MSTNGARTANSLAPLRVAWMRDEQRRSEACDRLHVATTAPRRLCTAGHVSGPSSQRTGRLDVDVSACPSRCGEVISPALVMMAGELSANTVDDAVRHSVFDYVRFARHTVIDLTRLETIDDEGARLLDELGESVADIGGSIAIHNPGVVVEPVIRFCGISDHITICAPR
jgi:anti-anti-sigma factor